MANYIKLVQSQAELTSFKASNDFVTPNVTVIYGDTSVDYNPYVPAPAIEMVDLGLPSGLKWATMNVGANSVTDAGLYFQWGDTQGYSPDQIGDGEGQKYFDWEDYKYAELDTSGSNGSGSGSGSGEIYYKMTKYNEIDGKTVLEPEDDAAYQATNGALRMPTEAEINELLNTTYVTNAWVNNYNGSDVNGRLFTSVSNGNTLFFPALGFCENDSLVYRGSDGRVWSSSIYPEYSYTEGFAYARQLLFVLGTGFVGNSYIYRRYGLCVRGVSL